MQTIPQINCACLLLFVVSVSIALCRLLYTNTYFVVRTMIREYFNNFNNDDTDNRME